SIHSSANSRAHFASIIRPLLSSTAALLSGQNDGNAEPSLLTWKGFYLAAVRREHRPNDGHPEPGSAPPHLARGIREPLGSGQPAKRLEEPWNLIRRNFR